MQTGSVLLARQPIHDRSLHIAGYELLFRSNEFKGDLPHSAERMTADVATHALLDIGLDTLVGQNRAWINVSREFLLGRVFQALPPDRVVLEVLESVTAEPEVLVAILEAREQGFTIALDDYELSHENAGLLDVCDYVKLDCLEKTFEQVRLAALTLRAAGCKLLAEKVETRELYDVCVEAGFELFQGYFFTRPSLVHGNVLASNRLQLVQLLAELHDPETTVERVADLVQSDVTLAYRLLRHANSAKLGRAVQFKNLRDAVTMLGLDRVRAFAALLILGSATDKPSELATTALVRARFCQLLGEALDGDPQKHFALGLFSILEAYLDNTMANITATLSLDAELNEALVHRAGELGAVLDAALTSETHGWNQAALGILTEAQIAECYVAAVTWANRAQLSMNGE